MTDLDFEKHSVRIFVFDSLIPDPTGRVFMHELFEEYKAWRKKNQLEPTRLSVDGFGKLFPKRPFERKVLGRGGQVGRGILGARLK